MADLHVDNSFYKHSIKIDNYVKIKEWIDSSIGQSTVIQELNKIRPTLSNLNQTQNRRRYRKNDLILIMTPEKQDKTLELSKHWSVDSTSARNEVIMKRTYPVKLVKCDKICSNY